MRADGCITGIAGIITQVSLNVRQYTLLSDAVLHMLRADYTVYTTKPVHTFRSSLSADCNRNGRDRQLVVGPLNLCAYIWRKPRPVFRGAFDIVQALSHTYEPATPIYVPNWLAAK